MPKPESIESFIGRLKDGLARPNRYIVSFALPPGVSGSNMDSAAGMAQAGSIHSSLTGMNENNMVEVLCHTCSMPGRGINTTDHVHYGAPYKAPIGQDYSTANFTFNTDTKYNSRKFFELWQQTIVNIETNTLNFYKEYIADVTIKAYDRENKETYSVVLHEAYPISISSVELGYGEKNSLVDVAVTMAYRYWSNEAIS